jgi:ubiquinone biosynthesis protein
MKSVSEDIPHLLLKRRRREIEELLAGFGLVHRPRRLEHVIDTKVAAASRARKLRMLLENLGPVFSAFGLYLSTRSDLLPAEDCVELGAIRDWLAPLPPAFVRSFISQELGHAPQEVFLSFEEKAFQSRLLFQSHHAFLPDGQAIVVRLIRPEVEEYLRCDAALVPLLKVAFAGEVLSGAKFDGMVEDYHYTLRRQIDCLQQASAFQVLARDAEEFGMLGVPVVHQSLCTSRLLTIESLSGSTLDEILHPSRQEKSTIRTRGDREDLARRLCTVWLRQVFVGRFFPVEPTAANTLILPNGQVAFTAGGFESLQPEPKTNLCDYLVATATDDSDRAYNCLFREVIKGAQAEEQDDLRKRFRQIVPLRDGAWTTSGDGDSFGEYVAAHWKLASEYGHLPPHLSLFFRAFFELTDVTRRLAPDRDTLLEGLQDMRLIGGVEKFREIVDPRQFAEQMEKYGAVLAELPRRLDEALTLVADGRARLKLQVPESSGHRRRRNSSSVVLSLLIALGGVALISHRLTSLPWVDSLSALVFITLGGLLLHVATRA